jgi:hypothetical protein
VAVQWSKGKTAASIVAVVIFLFGTQCWRGNRDLEQYANTAGREEPFFGFNVDLSKPGEYSGTIPDGQQEYDYPSLFLKTAPLFVLEKDAKAAVDGLSAQLTVVGKSGRERSGMILGSESVRPVCRSDCGYLWAPTIVGQRRIWRAGDTLTLTVRRGAPHLSGKSQLLVVEHEYLYLCGLGALALMMSWLTAVVCYVRACATNVSVV